MARKRSVDDVMDDMNDRQVQEAPMEADAPGDTSGEAAAAEPEAPEPATRRRLRGKSADPAGAD